MGSEASNIDRAVDHAIKELSRLGSLAMLPLPLRTILIVQAAQGVIDNGGLQYFFESDWPDEPPYEIFVDAYRAVGAANEADALASAVQLFPFPDPHKQRARRLDFLRPFQAGGSHRPDSPFEPFTNQLCGSKTIWPLLETYAAKHADAFPR